MLLYIKQSFIKKLSIPTNIWDKISLVIPILIYVFVMLHYSANIPILDDYNDTLPFLIDYKNTNSAYNKAMLLFSRTQDHIPVFPKLLILADYHLNGSINFKHLIVAANLNLLFIFLILYKSSENLNMHERKIFLLLPVSYLFYQIQYWEITTWTTAAIIFFPVFFYCLLAIYWLRKNKNGFFILTLISCVVATFTAANGILILPVIVAFLLFNKRLKELIAFIVFSLGLFLTFLYFYNYKTVTDKSVLSGLAILVQDPVLFFSNFLAAIGSSAGFGIEILSLISGGIILVWFLYLSYKKYYNKNPVIYFFMFFLLLTSFVIATKRAGFGVDLILLTSRYRVVSTLFLVMAYISFIETIHTASERFKYAKRILAPSIVFCILSYLLYLPFLSGRFNEVKTGVNGLLHNQPKHAYNIIQSAAQNDIYHLPAGYLYKIDPNYEKTAESKLRNFMGRFNDRNEKDTTLTFRVNIPHSNIFDSTFHVFLQKPAVIYLFNSGLTPTTIREVLHGVNPDDYKSELAITSKSELKK